jgi:hypothetical protein
MPLDNPATRSTPARFTRELFATHPQRGMANYAGPQEVITAAALVQRGAVFGLDYPLDAFVPSLATLRSARNTTSSLATAITAQRHRHQIDQRSTHNELCAGVARECPAHLLPPKRPDLGL